MKGGGEVTLYANKYSKISSNRTTIDMGNGG